MKKNVIKTAFAAVCVVAAGVSGMKAYNVETSHRLTCFSQRTSMH